MTTMTNKNYGRSNWDLFLTAPRPRVAALHLVLLASLALNTVGADKKSPAPPAPQYQKDAVVVQQSQEQALEQLQALKERAADPRAKAMIEAVEQEM